MKIQYIVLIAVIVASISLGLQVASNTKLQSDVKNIASKSAEQDAAIQHIAVSLNETLQVTDLKNKTTEQEKLIQSISNELSTSRQIEEKNNQTITQLQQNAEILNDQIKSLNDRLASLEHRLSSPPSPSVNAVTNLVMKPSNTSQVNQVPFPTNMTISMTKSEIKILSIAMSPNHLKVGDVPKFTVTFQNISNKEILQNMVGCGTNPSLHWEIYPPSSVQTQSIGNGGLTCSPIIKNVKSNETSIASGYATGNVLYQITQTGELNVILRMHLEDGSISGVESTMKFNVNVTQ